ncbi:MAG: hypothetical protein LBM98_00685 [Oscillospiraceae bacterium]|jgi:hypothetical protein|nr:hypothetical protein [Oscillospiraceae bacterium]
MKIRYLGQNVITSFTNNRIYDVLEVDKLTGALRITDDSGDDYLYSPTEPKLLSETYRGGRFEIIEDDKSGSLKRAIFGNAFQMSIDIIKGGNTIEYTA